MLLAFLSFILFVCCYFSFPLLKSFYLNKKNQVVLSDLDSFCGAFLCFWGFVGIIACSCFILDLVSFRALTAGLSLSLIVLYLSCKTLNKKIKVGVELLLCVAGSILILPGVAPFSCGLIALILLTSLFWWWAWHLFVNFDRFPLASFMMNSAWMMGLILGGYVVFRIPLLFVFAFELGLLGLVCMKKRLLYGQLAFGPSLTSLMGFLWAGVWAFFFLRGQFLSAICAYSYYLCEGGIMLYAYVKRKEITPLLLNVLNRPQVGNKGLKVIFMHLLLLIIICVLGMRLTGMLLFGLVVLIYVHLNMRLNYLEKGIPGYREILSDLKKGSQAAYQQTKEVFHKKGLEKGSFHPQKKKSVQKKVVKKKVVKGKKKK